MAPGPWTEPRSRGTPFRELLGKARGRSQEKGARTRSRCVVVRRRRDHGEVHSFFHFCLPLELACAERRAGRERTGARGDAGLSRPQAAVAANSPAPPRLRADSPRPEQACRRTGCLGTPSGGSARPGGVGEGKAEWRAGQGHGELGRRGDRWTGARPHREVSKISQGLGICPENTRGTFEAGNVWEKSLRPQKGWEGPRGSSGAV